MNPYDDLKAYVDGELPAERMADLRELEGTDAAWAAEVAEMRRIGTTLRAMAPQPTAVGLHSTLAALNRKSARPWFRQPWVPALVCASLAAVVMSTVLRQVSTPATAMKGDKVAFMSERAKRPEAPEAMTSEAATASPLADFRASKALPPHRDPNTAGKPERKVDNVAAPQMYKGPVPVPAPVRERTGTKSVPLATTPLQTTDHPVAARDQDDMMATKAEVPSQVAVVAVAVTRDRENIARSAVVRLASDLGVDVVSTKSAFEPPAGGLEFVGDGPAVEELRRRIPSTVREALKASATLRIESESRGAFGAGGFGGGGANPPGGGFGAAGGGGSRSDAMNPTLYDAASKASGRVSPGGIGGGYAHGLKAVRSRRLRVKFTVTAPKGEPAAEGKVKP